MDVERSGSPCFLGERPGGRGDPSPAVFERSQLLSYQTVELRFHDTITTINTIFLESLPAKVNS